MAEAKMPDGSTERGPANQRHLARAIGKVDGAHVVVSYTSGHLAASVGSIDALTELRALAEQWGAEMVFDGDLSGYQYDNGNAAIEFEF